MGRPDPSAREIMGNRQAGQSGSLCLHNEQRDGVRGHPHMCSGDGILSGCLNKAPPPHLVSTLCAISACPTRRPLRLSLSFWCSCFSLFQVLIFGEQVDVVSSKKQLGAVTPFCMMLNKVHLKYLLNLSLNEGEGNSVV